MGEWSRRPLGEVLTLQRGHDLPTGSRSFGSVPVIGSFGITGYHDPETTDESPERVALLQHASTAYLHHTLELNTEPWTRLQNELAADSGALGRIDSK